MNLQKRAEQLALEVCGESEFKFDVAFIQTGQFNEGWKTVMQLRTNGEIGGPFFITVEEQILEEPDEELDERFKTMFRLELRYEVAQWECRRQHLARTGN